MCRVCGRPSLALILGLASLLSADGECCSQPHLPTTLQRGLFKGTGSHLPSRLFGALRGGGQEARGGPRTLDLKSITCPDKSLALTNHVYLNGADFSRMFDDASSPPRFVQIGGFIFTASESQAVTAGSVAFNSAQRKTLKLSSGDSVQVTEVAELPQSKIHAASVELAVDFAGRATPNEALPAQTVAAHVLRSLDGQVLTVGQQFISETCGLNLLFTAKSVLTFKEQPPHGAHADSAEIRALWSGGGVMRTGLMGLVGPACKIGATAAKGSSLKITDERGGSSTTAQQRGSQLFSPDFSLEDLGIGGLDAQVCSSAVLCFSPFSRRALSHACLACLLPRPLLFSLSSPALASPPSPPSPPSPSFPSLLACLTTPRL